MSEENRQQQSSAESTVAGAAKTGKAIASIAKGAATGGAHGAAVEAAKSSKKWIIPIVAVILLPVLIIAMLPSVIFGSMFGDGTDTPNGISDDTVLVQNLADINSGISMILSEGLNDVLARIDSDFAASGCDSKEVNNPFGSDVVFNANAIVSQYCAYKDTDATSISKDDKASKHKSSVAKKKQPLHAEDFIPVSDIRNGIIETTDGRYLRVIEVEPINFLLRNISEQKNIVASFASWMKISPVKVQIKVLTKKADIGKHLNTIEREMEAEDNPKCRDLQLDYYHLIQTIGSREAITRRFLVIFEYEAVTNRKPEYAEIVSALETAVQTARQYFLHCDNAVVAHEDENIFLMEVLYTIFNRATCEVKPVEKRVRELQAARKDTDISVPVPLKSVLAPESIDLTHGSYVVMDGVYHAYLIVPSDGYNPQVVAGWTSILVNAGEGIDVDFFFSREPKERIQAKLGQQIRINRSRLKDTSDTNTDFDDFESAIRSGYFLKEGLANYEDFYYCNTLVTVTADTLENLEWRISEVRRLMISQDILSFSSAAKDYDLIPGSKQNIPAINAARTVVAEATVRLIVVDDLSTLDEVEPRLVNDYGILVGPNGVEQIYKM